MSRRNTPQAPSAIAFRGRLTDRIWLFSSVKITHFPITQVAGVQE